MRVGRVIRGMIPPRRRTALLDSLDAPSTPGRHAFVRLSAGCHHLFQVVDEHVYDGRRPAYERLDRTSSADECRNRHDTQGDRVYIDSVDLNAHTITVDPMSFLTGTAAVNAFKVDHPDAKEGPPNDYYIVNVTKDHNPLPFPATSTVRLVDVGGTNHNPPVTVAQAKLAG